LHLNPIIPGVPYVESEGVPQTSDYWDWVDCVACGRPA